MKLFSENRMLSFLSPAIILLFCGTLLNDGFGMMGQGIRPDPFSFVFKGERTAGQLPCGYSEFSDLAEGIFPTNYPEGILDECIIPVLYSQFEEVYVIDEFDEIEEEDGRHSHGWYVMDFSKISSIDIANCDNPTFECSGSGEKVIDLGTSDGRLEYITYSFLSDCTGYTVVDYQYTGDDENGDPIYNPSFEGP